MIDSIPAARNKLKEMREQVKKELEHIPRGNLQQNFFRQCYQSLRMHSLGKYAKTDMKKEDVLKQSIDIIKIDNPEFKPQYDNEFFNIKKL